MPGNGLVESDVEDAALDWFAGERYTVLHGSELTPGEPGGERAAYTDVLLEERLHAAIARLNPAIPASAQHEAVRVLRRRESPSLVLENRTFHRRLVDGVPVEYTNAAGKIVGDSVRLVDWDDAPGMNDWLVINQFTVIEGEHHRRPDIVVFLNGLPVAVIELKNAADENATIWSAFNQLQTYKSQLSTLFTFNEALVISDGLEARVGSLTADKERFARWRTIAGEELAPAGMPELQILIQGLFHRERFLQFLRHFIVFEAEGEYLHKKLAAYHQFHAVNAAVEQTVAASRPEGTRKAGVVWHTQGSGKSLTMAFYAGRLVLHPAMDNPTLVVLTDRNDLDQQLYGTFSRCADLLRQSPQQADSREGLRGLLKVASGGVVFTTIQKFFPEEKGDSHPQLSPRRNIVVIADEAHRSQYDFIDGFARYMRDALPNASFIGFTGTPIESTDANTRAVFGDYVSVYDIQRAVEDGATVPIYYESRLAQLALAPEEQPRLDERFEEVTEGEEETKRERLKSKWSALEAVVGSPTRLRRVAADLVQHFEQRQEAMEGKAMVVCMSRRICVDLYDELVRLRPDWHAKDDAEGAVKVVMTGSASDELSWQKHIRPKAGRERLAQRFKDPGDALKLVIVRDMWLTGFDAPPMHTIYVDKPMQGHGLMQAIARVNRVFKDKPGGLVVDYLGLANQLREALATYTEAGGQGQTAVDQNEAVAVMLEKYEVVRAMFHGFDYSRFSEPGVSPGERLGVVGGGMEHILAQPDGKERLLRQVTDLSRAFALAVPHDETLAIRDDVAYFQAVRAALAKKTVRGGKTDEELDHAVRQLLSRALVSNDVVDIFAVAGLDKPDLSILSDEFLADVRGLTRKNVAVELLQRLLNDELSTVSRRNVVQFRSFTEMLTSTIRRYQARSVETAQVIEELIQLAQEVQAARQRGANLGLTADEEAFYDALAANMSAVEVLGDAQLRAIAQELVVTVRRNVSVDWTIKESVRAHLRRTVKRTLRKYGYPPDLEESATRTVLEQAEVLSAGWAA